MNELECPAPPLRPDAPVDADASARWLSESEMEAWLALNAAMRLLPAALDAHLREQADLSLFEYLVLAMLSQSDGLQMTSGELARVVDGSVSRLTHVLDRLQDAGLVERCRGLQDRRTRVVSLTDAGLERVVTVAPGHVASVRQLVFDGLSPAQVAVLARVTGLVAARSRQALAR